MAIAKFGERIKRLREIKVITQQDFANKIGVTKTTVNSWEKDGKFPSLDTAARIAKTFEVSLDWLWGMETPAKPITYRDVIMELISLIDLIDMEVSYVKNLDDNDEDIIQLLIKEPLYNWALKDWITVRELYRQHTIDKKIYLTWLDGKYSNFEKYLYGVDDDVEMMVDIIEETMYKNDQESE